MQLLIQYRELGKNNPRIFGQFKITATNYCLPNRNLNDQYQRKISLWRHPWKVENKSNICIKTGARKNIETPNFLLTSKCPITIMSNVRACVWVTNFIDLNQLNNIPVATF